MAAVIVYRRIELEIVRVKKALVKRDLDDQTRKNFSDQLDLLQEIKAYLHSFVWLRNKKTKERVKTFIELKYSYEDSVYRLNEESLTAFQTSMWYTAKKFEELIGTSTLDLISDGRIDDAVRQFHISIGKLNLSSVLLSGVSPLLPEQDSTYPIWIADCLRELKVLANLSSNKVESVLSTLDETKVAFLRYVLEGTDIRYLRHREVIYEFLSNPGNIKENADKLEILLRDADLVLKGEMARHA